MIRISDKRKCMASLVTFRNMYNKADIYDVIAELALQTIVEKGVSTSRIDQFCSLFRDETGIETPFSIIETSLKRLSYVQIDHKLITVTDKLTKDVCETVKQNVYEQEQKNNALFESLKVHVEKELDRQLTPDEDKSLINTLCSHIVDESYPGPFVENVCSFILKNQDNREFMEYLNLLREGTIIFVGYTYTAQDGYFDKIDNVIHIYCETEILFHMAGYNRPLYKTLFDEFYNQVEAINKKKRNPIIRLYYFEETEVEIDNYFKTACNIVERNQIPDPTKQAMVSICEGCTEAYQVKEKQAEFKRLLKEHHISLDSQNSYNDVGNYELTIEHGKFLDIEDASEDKINEKLKFLNNINVKRDGRPQRVFRNVGHILLSGNSLTFRIAFDEAVRQKGSLPLVFSLSSLTNRFWLALNKGLVPDMKLSNFNMVAKSRVALANRLNVAVTKIYKELEIEMASGKMSMEQVRDNLAELRRDCKSPDQINEDEVDNCLSIIKNGELELYISVKENEKRRVEERIKDADEKVKVAEDRVIEVEGRVGKLKEVNFAAINVIVEERNKANKLEYDKEIENYEERKVRFVEWDYKEYKKEQRRRITCYIIVYLVLYIAFSLFSKNQIKGLIGVLLGALVSVVWNFIPFLRAIESYDDLKKAFRFLTSESEREKVRKGFEEEYEELYPRPELKFVTAEDIAFELEGKANEKGE